MLSIVIVTGQSGSGKSTAVRALEDRDYFCVDNMPPSLVTQLIGVLEKDAVCDRLALVMDIREGNFLEHAPTLVQNLRDGPHVVHLVYLEASEDALIRRYSETRRRHPLDHHGEGLRQSIATERAMLAPLRELASDTLDTTAMSPHALRQAVSRRIAGAHVVDTLRIALQSFGFKHGLPLEADIVLDVRFLTNPYFEPRLRHKTGLDTEVQHFVMASPEAQSFAQRAGDLLTFLFPLYRREGKHYLTVAIGCTGGCHRSVAMVQKLAQHLDDAGMAVDVQHRDIEEKRL